MLNAGFSHETIAQAMDYQPTWTRPELLSEYGAAITPGTLVIPNSYRLDSEHLELYIVDDFLDDDECKNLIELIRGGLRPSTITNKKEADRYYRTSYSADLKQSLEVSLLNERICKTMGIHPSYAENIQGQDYQIGQEFKLHPDYFSSDSLKEYSGGMGQRTFTVLVYLNDVDDGGETEFPKVGLKIKPVRGRAVIWNNLNADGSPNLYSHHRAFPVHAGRKTIITKWFRSYSKEQPAPSMWSVLG